MSDYQRIARAIDFIVANVESQPDLDAVASHLNLSPYHFQRLFSRWAGVSPKRFLQVVTLERAKASLNTGGGKSQLTVSGELGLSSNSRLYEHFVTLEAMTPMEFKMKGEGLSIYYGLHQTPFGNAFLAETERGICSLVFVEDADKKSLIQALQFQWPRAELIHKPAQTDKTIHKLFNTDANADGNGKRAKPLSLLVKGTNFQVNVWRALLKIPTGQTCSYGDIAKAIGRPKANRAVGTAVGANPIAFLIPCHRVIRESGALGGYRWGLTRKRALLAWETMNSQKHTQ